MLRDYFLPWLGCGGGCGKTGINKRKLIIAINGTGETRKKSRQKPSRSDCYDCRVEMCLYPGKVEKRNHRPFPRRQGGTPSPVFDAQPPLYDSEEPKPRILNVVLDSQSNKYGEKWVRVWRRAIKNDWRAQRSDLWWRGRRTPLRELDQLMTKSRNDRCL